MTTQQVEQPSEDALAQAVQEAAGQIAPETAQQPVYVTREEAAKMARDAAWEAVKQEGERIRRQMQSSKDKEVSEIRQRFETFEAKYTQNQDTAEIQRITSIPDETERTTQMMQWMAGKVSKAQQPQSRQQPEPVATTTSVVEDVQQRVRQEIPEHYHDVRLWEGASTGLTVDQNMDIIRRNAATIRGQKPFSPTQPAAQQTPGRQPQAVPARTSPAAGGARMTEEEVEDWLAKEPTNPQALKAYKEMQARQGRTV